ncbi:MAG: DUF3429 domain-containing protein [Chitinophagaceae bacterium]|nr:DUF3429 domain-containing protein [Rubrivivax sp.]
MNLGAATPASPPEAARRLPVWPAAPVPGAQWLAYGGLLPFVGCAGLVWLVRPEFQAYAALALSAYAAAIVSFLGGIHWGLAFCQRQPRPALFAWGVVPSLVAWLAMMMPPLAGLVLHGLMLVVCYAVDRRVYPMQGAQHWLTLRLRLTAVAAPSCFVGAAGI